MNNHNIVANNRVFNPLNSYMCSDWGVKWYWVFIN